MPHDLATATDGKYYNEKLRYILQGTGCGHNNQWVREQCRVYTASNMLCIRRLKFCFRGILLMAEYDTQSPSPLPAALCGSGQSHLLAQLGPRGQPLAGRNPWLMMLLTTLALPSPQALSQRCRNRLFCGRMFQHSERVLFVN